MATHDYVIDNGTGSAVRSDLNNLFKAILTHNSGTSDPSTIISSDAGSKAFSFWADTNASPAVMKLRNAADDDWIPLFELDGTFLLTDGTNSAPALGFADDRDTGVYSSAANTFNVATGGTERMELGTTTIFNEDGEDVDFRIEGDANANLFYVDAGNDRIAIGHSSPDTLLHLAGENTSIIRLENTDTSITAADVIIGALEFEKQDPSGSGAGVCGALRMKSIDSTGIGTYLALSVSNASNNDFEALRIDSAGDLGIGTTAPDEKLHISGSSSGAITAKIENTYSSDATRFAILELKSGVGSIRFTDQSDNIDAEIKFDTASNVMEFKTDTGSGSAERMKIDASHNLEISDGNLVIGTSGHGIDFSATSDASGMTSELLDDYEEGTWAPFFTGDSTSGSYTYSSRNGVYTKVGRVCHFQFDLIVSGISGAGTGNLVINNLPFTSVSSPHSGAAIGYYAHWNSVVPSQLLINTNSTNIFVYKNSQTSTVLNATPADLLTNTRVIAFGSYVVA